MTVATQSSTTQLSNSSQLRPITGLVNFLLSIKPLASFAKSRARKMMIDRAEAMGVYWRQEAAFLSEQNLEALRQKIENPALVYPDYYLTSFHAYEEGNLGWLPATEVEVAARAVHAKIWPEAKERGDRKLRDSFLDIVDRRIDQTQQPITAIVDLGCSVGLSTFRIHDRYPTAQMTGIDLSSYFLAVAMYRDAERQAERQAEPNTPDIRWIHAAAEATTLDDNCCDLVTLFLVCHELPAEASCDVFREARRILRSGGHLAIMEMNPKSEIYAQMPPYVFTLLKSTEPYLDSYFNLDLEQALIDAGFNPPTIDCNSPRHRTVIARAS
ncbi:MAG: class I SAM-dependent methyltransferase [Coleofasciculaceae cyanobacterium RL_1_1]|nr:class I SAM-dependent methyltransferase [Coleofasciculaceae cyanobacterium RL_1_1]